MKAELDEKGVLCIRAENSVEAFALTYWGRMWRDKTGEAELLIDNVVRNDNELDHHYEEIKPQ